MLCRTVFQASSTVLPTLIYSNTISKPNFSLENLLSLYGIVIVPGCFCKWHYADPCIITSIIIIIKILQLYGVDVCGLLGGRYKSWKRRWFILNDNCLYYFQFTTVSSPLTHPVLTLRMMSMSLCLELIISLRPFIIVDFLLAEASVGRLDYTRVKLCGRFVLLVKTCAVYL